MGVALLISDRRLIPDLRLCIGQSEDGIRQPPLEPLVVCELFEELHIVIEHGSHHAPQSFVMLDPGVTVGRVPRNLGRNLLRNEAANPVRVLPGDIPRYLENKTVPFW